MSDTNYNISRLGNHNGEIKFGHIHDDSKISAAIIRSGSESNHYISLESEGQPHRKNGTICRSTGAFQIVAGDDVKSSGISENIGVYIEAVDGDIVLSAKNGRVRILGENIDIIARGGDAENGNINIDANEKVNIKGDKGVNITSKVSLRLVTDGRLDAIGKAILNCYGGLMDFADGSTSLIGSKGGSVFEKVLK